MFKKQDLLKELKLPNGTQALPTDIKETIATKAIDISTKNPQAKKWAADFIKTNDIEDNNKQKQDAIAYIIEQLVEIFRFNNQSEVSTQDLQNLNFHTNKSIKFDTDDNSTDFGKFIKSITDFKLEYNKFRIAKSLIEYLSLKNTVIDDRIKSVIYKNITIKNGIATLELTDNQKNEQILQEAKTIISGKSIVSLTNYIQSLKNADKQAYTVNHNQLELINNMYSGLVSTSKLTFRTLPKTISRIFSSDVLLNKTRQSAEYVRGLDGDVIDGVLEDEKSRYYLTRINRLRKAVLVIASGLIFYTGLLYLLPIFGVILPLLPFALLITMSVIAVVSLLSKATASYIYQNKLSDTVEKQYEKLQKESITQLKNVFSNATLPQKKEIIERINSVKTTNITPAYISAIINECIIKKDFLYFEITQKHKQYITGTLKNEIEARLNNINFQKGSSEYNNLESNLTKIANLYYLYRSYKGLSAPKLDDYLNKLEDKSTILKFNKNNRDFKEFLKEIGTYIDDKASDQDIYNNITNCVNNHYHKRLKYLQNQVSIDLHNKFIADGVKEKYSLYFQKDLPFLKKIFYFIWFTITGAPSIKNNPFAIQASVYAQNPNLPIDSTEFQNKVIQKQADIAKENSTLKSKITRAAKISLPLIRIATVLTLAILLTLGLTPFGSVGYFFSLVTLVLILAFKIKDTLTFFKDLSQNRKEITAYYKTKAINLERLKPAEGIINNFQVKKFENDKELPKQIAHWEHDTKPQVKKTEDKSKGLDASNELFKLLSQIQKPNAPKPTEIPKPQPSTPKKSHQK